MKKKWLILAGFFVVLVGVLFYSKSNVYEHDLAVCTIFKDEAPYLKEWIDYHHHILGVTRFYLYDNDSTDDYQSVLQPYIEKGIVEVIPWESSEEHAIRGWIPDETWVVYQIGAYNNCLKKRALGKARWVAMIDVDEFIVPTNGVDSFKKILKQYSYPWSSVGSIKIHWKVFGTSNVWDLAPGELQIEKLYLRSQDDHGWNRRQVKSIHRPEAIDICLIHTAKKILWEVLGKKPELS